MGNEAIGFVWLKQLLETGPEVMFKIFMVVGTALYIFFALVVVKQVGIMTESIEADMNPYAKLFAWAHLFLAIGLLVVAIVI